MGSDGVIAKVVDAAAEVDGFDRSGAFLSCGGGGAGAADTTSATIEGDGSWFEAGSSTDPLLGTMSIPMLVLCVVAGMMFVAWAAALGTFYSYSSTSRDKQPRETGASAGLSRPPPGDSSAVPTTQEPGAKSGEEGVSAADGGNAGSSSLSARRSPAAHGGGRPMSWSARRGGVEPISPIGVENRATAKVAAACGTTDEGLSSHGVTREDASEGDACSSTSEARIGRGSNGEGVVGVDGVGSREEQRMAASAPVEIDAVEGDEKRTSAMDSEEEPLLAEVGILIGQIERDLDAARVLLPECHRFRQVVGYVSEAVGPGMRTPPRQSMDLTEALKEAKEFTRTLSSPEPFLVCMAELLADGVQDPSAMLGQCTRRLSLAVSALPEPSPSAGASASPSTAAARAQLRSIAKSSPVGSGIARSSSAAAIAINGGGGVSAQVTASSSTSWSSGVTATVTPPVLVLPVAGEGVNESAPSVPYGGRRSVSVDVQRDDPSSGADLALAGGADTFAGVASLTEAGRDSTTLDSVTLDSVGLGADGGLEIEGQTACSGSSGEPPDGSDVRRSIGPALTSEAAGLSDLIRRRGGLAALSDGRAVAAVLRAAAPRRQSAFHNQRARGFFNAEAIVDEGLGGSVPVLSTPPQRGVGGNSGDGDGSRARDDRGEVPGGEASSADGGLASGVPGGTLYVSTTCSGMFFSTKSPVLEQSSSYEVLRWPSPQDTSGICQKLARRVESRVEAMAPFACPHPIPASEHRRLRNVKVFFFSIILPQPDGGADLFRGGDPVVNEAGNNGTSSGDQSSYPLSSSSSTRRAVWSRHRTGGGGDVTGRGVSQRPVPDLEEQLYAGLGSLLEAAKELLPGAREGGAAVNVVGKSAVLTLKGMCALDRSPLPRDTSLSIIPRKNSVCQHTVCTPRFGRKTLEGGVRHEDGVLLVPDCRKLRQEMIRSTCMDPAGAIRPDYVAYAGAPVFVGCAPLGTMCVFSRRTLKDLGWTAHHTSVLRGLADAASTEMMRLCRIAEVGDQQQRRKLRAAPESPELTPTTSPRVSRRSQRVSASPTVLEPASRAPNLPEITTSVLRLAPTHPSSEEAAELVGSSAGRIVAAAGFRGPSSSLSPVRTADVGDGGATHVPPVTVEVAAGTPQQSRPPQRLPSSRRLDGVASRSLSIFARRRLNAADRERSENFRLPQLTRRFSGGEAGTGAAAAAGGSDAGGETIRVRPPGNSNERWRRALSKLRLKRRPTSLEEGSNDGHEGSSSSA